MGVKIKQHFYKIHYYTIALILLLASVTFYTSQKSQVEALGHYQNYELADYALTFNKKDHKGHNIGYGGDACAKAGLAHMADGECKTFVDCVVYAVSGKTQRTFPGYHSGFGAHGVEVARSSTARGDIIQVLPGAGPLQHTAIINQVYNDGSFEVIDSNWGRNGIVQVHKWKPASDARFWRMGQVGLNGPVIGSLDSIRRAPGGIYASGWSIDQDIPSATYVHLYSGDGELKPTNPGKELYANQYREDIGRVYPRYGPGHGYSGVVAARNAGHQRVCAYGINVSGTSGGNVQLGCKDIDVSPDPFGKLESVTRVEGGVQVRGWAIDPDTASSINVHIYGGSGAPDPTLNQGTTALANANRNDVAAHYPGYGAKHGFNVFFPISPKKQNFCVYAINNAVNTHNPQIGCKSV